MRYPFWLQNPVQKYINKIVGFELSSIQALDFESSLIWAKIATIFVAVPRHKKKKKKKKWAKNPCKFGCVFLVWVPSLRLHRFKIRKSRIFSEKICFNPRYKGLCFFLILDRRKMAFFFKSTYIVGKFFQTAWFSLLRFWVQPAKIRITLGSKI